MSKFTIRNYQHPTDYQIVFDLWSNAGEGIHIRKSDQIEEIEKKISRDPDLFLVAEFENKIVGAVLGGFDGRRGMVYHLAVQSDFRNQGLGNQLMDELEERLKGKGCVKYYLLVDKRNTGALDFYLNNNCEIMDLYALGKDL